MSTFGLAEAFASWQWVNYLISKVPAGKKPLLINMDETAVCLFQGTGRGTIIAPHAYRQSHDAMALLNTFLAQRHWPCSWPKGTGQVVCSGGDVALVSGAKRSDSSSSNSSCTRIHKLLVTLPPPEK